jgi:hypothetical protein
MLSFLRAFVIAIRKMVQNVWTGFFLPFFSLFLPLRTVADPGLVRFQETLESLSVQESHKTVEDNLEDLMSQAMKIRELALTMSRLPPASRIREMDNATAGIPPAVCEWLAQQTVAELKQIAILDSFQIQNLLEKCATERPISSSSRGNASFSKVLPQGHNRPPTSSNGRRTQVRFGLPNDTKRATQGQQDSVQIHGVRRM